MPAFRCSTIPVDVFHVVFWYVPCLPTVERWKGCRPTLPVHTYVLAACFPFPSWAVRRYFLFTRRINITIMIIGLLVRWLFIDLPRVITPSYAEKWLIWRNFTQASAVAIFMRLCASNLICLAKCTIWFYFSIYEEWALRQMSG